MKFHRRRLFVIALFVFIASAVLQASAQDPETFHELSRSFRKFDLVHIAISSTENFAGDAKQLRFTADGKYVELNIVENDLRSFQYKAENTGPEGDTLLADPTVITFKGKVTGEPGSQVRLSIRGSKIEGYFQLNGESLFIEPASKYSKSASEFESVIYRAEDSMNDNSFECLADVPTRIKAGDRMVSKGNLRSLESLRRFEIATEADVEWVNMFGSPAAANQEIMSILNMIEGTFIAELELQIRVTFQHTWTTADPFASSSGAGGILSNFRTYWNTNYPNASYPRHVAHLFTAKSNALSQGVAYLGVVCLNGSATYGLSGHVGWAPGKYLVPAHELGHNLGGQHAEAAQSCSNSLMNAQLTGSTPMSFCAYSQSQINTYISTSGSCMMRVTPKRFDFDGDNRADTAVFRRSEGLWHIRKPDGSESQHSVGSAGDRLVPADYDGDGRTDVAVFRDGQWLRVLSLNNTLSTVTFGNPGDVPATADYDGDGRFDLAVFRRSTGQWLIRRSSDQTDQTATLGGQWDVPLPADYDGDGKADVNVFRLTTRTWHRINSSNGQLNSVQFGNSRDRPLLGDFDGDGRADVAVFRPLTSQWFVIASQTGNQLTYSFGNAGDVPTPGDYDGDGRTEIAVFRPSDGSWNRLIYSSGSTSTVTFGTAEDIPIPAYYIPQKGWYFE